MKKLHQKMLAKAQKGATMVEYALIVALIALAVITTVTAVGVQLDAKFGLICEKLGGTAAECNPAD